LAPNFRALDAGGGINITADGARLLDLNANQRLLFGLTGDYHHNSMDFGTSVLTPGVTNAGSVRRDIYSVIGSAIYSINTFYLTGRAALDLSHADITNNVNTPGAQGSTNGRGYTLNVTAGNLFPLFSTIGRNPATIVKAPPSVMGGYALFLDVSGHYSYRSERDDGFTDGTAPALATAPSNFPIATLARAHD
jgi:hypothetical protein